MFSICEQLGNVFWRKGKQWTEFWAGTPTKNFFKALFISLELLLIYR